MLIPPLCQTCGQPIGHLYQIYLETLQKLSREANVAVGPNQESQPERLNQPTPEYLARQTLIKEHGLDGRRQCCLYAMMVNHDVTDIIT